MASKMRVLISGAGVAGLTTAYWLSRYGYTPTIIERAPELLTGGYKIDVRGSALQVLKMMGIYDAVVADSTHMQGALLVDKNGRTINEMSGDAFGHRVGEDVEIIRGKLCHILKKTIPDIEFIFGDTIQEISELTDSMQVKFKKNKPREFDLVIGADGLHSTVRQLAFGDESRYLRGLGLYLCVFTIPNYLNLNRLEIQYSEIGKVAAVWSANEERDMKACFGFSATSSKIDLNNREQQQQVLKKIYNGINWEVPRLLKMMPEATDFYFDAAAQIHMDHWSQGRVVLVGDAGYCASPMSGQGTSLAFIGAYVLAGELATAKGNYKIAFEKYESAMRHYVKVNQELGITAAKFMKSQGNNNIFLWLLKKLTRIIPGRLIKFVIDLSTRRIKKTANSIVIKDYLSNL